MDQGYLDAGDSSPMLRSAQLTRAAGTASVMVAVAHTAMIGRRARPFARGWLAGDLRGGGLRDPDHAGSAAVFWALAGVGVPLAAVGAAALQAGRQGQVLPAWIGPAFLALGGAGAAATWPSGFPGLVVVGSLFTAARQAERSGHSAEEGGAAGM